MTHVGTEPQRPQSVSVHGDALTGLEFLTQLHCVQMGSHMDHYIVSLGEHT